MTEILDRIRKNKPAKYAGLDLTEVAAEIDKLTAERDRLREALEMIAGKRQCLDNLMSDKDIARES